MNLRAPFERCVVSRSACLCLSRYPLNHCVIVVKILQKVLNRKQDTEVKRNNGYLFHTEDRQLELKTFFSQQQFYSI